MYCTVGTKNYKVIRGIKPNKFEIYADDDLLNQDASTVDYQNYLEKTWLEELSKKYPIKLNLEVLYSLGK